MLVLLSVFALGLGTTFPVTVVSIQNAVARPQIGTVTGAMNFFRSLASSFTVAAFATTADGAGRGHFALPASIAVRSARSRDDMINAFRYVFGAAAALMTCAVLCMILMEERPLAGPSSRSVEMAE